MIRNYYGGQWTPSLGTQTVEVANPATGEILGHTPLGTAEDVHRAVMAAKAAFPGWRQTPAVDRIQPFFRLKALLGEHQEELARLVTIEHGKTLLESRGSIRRAIQMVETACGIPALMMGQYSEDIAPGIDCFAVRRPMGVFAVIAPFNFPAMVPFWFWPFGVAAGNTIVIKPSERVPLTQLRIFELIEQAGFPKGVVNLVHGGRDVVNALCTHPDIKGVSFVGSTPVALHVYKTATAHGKRAQALGGAKNTMVVLPDADLARSTKIALDSITGCSGQRCLAGSILLSVGAETAAAVQDLIVRAASEVVTGDGLDERTTMGPVISEEPRRRIIGLIESAEAQGARVLLDGRQGVDRMPGFFLKPTVIAGVTRDMRVAQEEIFGPVILLAQVDTFDEAIEWVNDSPYGNTTTLFTSSGAAARRYCYEVDPSMIGINIGVPAPMSFFQFGGTKDSLFGDIKAHGTDCTAFFTDVKTTVQRWMKDSHTNVWRA